MPTALPSCCPLTIVSLILALAWLTKSQRVDRSEVGVCTRRYSRARRLLSTDQGKGGSNVDAWDADAEAGATWLILHACLIAYGLVELCCSLTFVAVLLASVSGTCTLTATDSRQSAQRNPGRVLCREAATAEAVCCRFEPFLPTTTTTAGVEPRRKKATTGGSTDEESGSTAAFSAANDCSSWTEEFPVEQSLRNTTSTTQQSNEQPVLRARYVARSIRSIAALTLVAGLRRRLCRAAVLSRSSRQFLLARVDAEIKRVDHSDVGVRTRGYSRARRLCSTVQGKGGSNAAGVEQFKALRRVERRVRCCCA
jgi:hypothetical protein